jgi:hypothetical protein
MQNTIISHSQTRVWTPAVGTSWQYVLKDVLRLQPSFPINQADVWIIDLFDTPASTVAALHGFGKRVVAYFSAGTFEDWRPDASQFSKDDLGRKMDDWEGEKWLQTNSAAVRNIMRARLELARSKGFDGVDPDNIDAYDNKNGLKLKKADAIDYVLFLAQEAHARGLSVGLKNGADIVPKVIDHVEFCVQEQALEFDDVEAFDLFIKRSKPVFHVEYPKGDDPDNKKHNNTMLVEGKKREKVFRLKQKGWSTIVKNICLDEWCQTD